MVSGLLSVALKSIAFAKEIVIANYFGVSANVDFYVIFLLVASFFVGPISGSFGTLLIQKFIELREKSFLASVLIYRQIFIFVCLIFLVVIIIQMVFLSVTIFGGLFSSFFASAPIYFLFGMFFIALFSAMTTVNRAVITAEKQFALFTAIPVVVPICIICFLIIDPIQNIFLSLIVGTIFGYFTEAMISISCNLKLWRINLERPFNLSDNTFKTLNRNFFPIFAGKIIMSGCLVVDQFMASLAGEGAVSVINYGNRLPLGLLTLASIIWTVLFPMFSELVSQKKHQSLLSLYINSIILAALIFLSIGIIGFVVSPEIVSFLYQRGEFTNADVLIVSEIQANYFFYLPFYIICLISARVANSYEKPKYIILANSTALAVNVLLNFVFISYYGVLGITYATILTYAFVSLYWVLVSRNLIKSSIG